MGTRSGNPLWKNSKSGNTPITAEALNRIEDALDSEDTYISELIEDSDSAINMALKSTFVAKAEFAPSPGRFAQPAGVDDTDAIVRLQRPRRERLLCPKLLRLPVPRLRNPQPRRGRFPGSRPGDHREPTDRLETLEREDRIYAHPCRARRERWHQALAVHRWLVREPQHRRLHDRCFHRSPGRREHLPQRSPVGLAVRAADGPSIRRLRQEQQVPWVPRGHGGDCRFSLPQLVGEPHHRRRRILQLLLWRGQRICLGED